MTDPMGSTENGSSVTSSSSRNSSSSSSLQAMPHLASTVQEELITQPDLQIKANCSGAGFADGPSSGCPPLPPPPAAAVVVKVPPPVRRQHQTYHLQYNLEDRGLYLSYDPIIGIQTGGILGTCLVLVMGYVIYKTWCSNKRWTSTDQLYVDQYKRRMERAATRKLANPDRNPRPPAPPDDGNGVPSKPGDRDQDKVKSVDPVSADANAKVTRGSEENSNPRLQSCLAGSRSVCQKTEDCSCSSCGQSGKEAGLSQAPRTSPNTPFTVCGTNFQKYSSNLSPLPPPATGNSLTSKSANRIKRPKELRLVANSAVVANASSVYPQWAYVNSVSSQVNRRVEVPLQDPTAVTPKMTNCTSAAARRDVAKTHGASGDATAMLSDRGFGEVGTSLGEAPSSPSPRIAPGSLVEGDTPEDNPTEPGGHQGTHAVSGTKPQHTSRKARLLRLLKWPLPSWARSKPSHADIPLEQQISKETTLTVTSDTTSVALLSV